MESQSSCWTIPAPTWPCLPTIQPVTVRVAVAVLLFLNHAAGTATLHQLCKHQALPSRSSPWFTHWTADSSTHPAPGSHSPTLLPNSRLTVLPIFLPAAASAACGECSAITPGPGVVSSLSGAKYYRAPCNSAVNLVGTLAMCKPLNFTGFRSASNCGDGTCYTEVQINGSFYYVADRACGETTSVLSTSDYFACAPPQGESLMV